MKRIVCIMLLLGCLATTVRGERIEVGGKAPRIQGVEWISDRPMLGEKWLMVEFFHSAGSECRAHINPCNELSHRFRHEMDVVVLTREPAEQVAQMLLHEYQYFYVATDESGALYKAFGVDHVPYAVIVNPRGRVVWTGNPWGLTYETIEKLLQTNELK